jgi:hypothetical protein
MRLFPGELAPAGEKSQHETCRLLRALYPGSKPGIGPAGRSGATASVEASARQPHRADLRGRRGLRNAIRRDQDATSRLRGPASGQLHCEPSSPDSHCWLSPHPLLSFGVAFNYAFLSAKNCPTGSTCSASDKRVWGEVRFHVIPDRVFSPWISVGGGYEWFDLSETTRVLGSHLDLSGWEADVEVGGDIRATPFLTLGPYLGVRAGRYTFRSLLGTGVTTGYGSRDIDSEDQTTHGWVAFGVRGAFALFPR